ncbi:MAG: thiamine pyrophosphate-binding protein [Nitrososphaerales archaeon]
MQDKQQSAEYNSDLLVDEIRALGIEYVSLNPGATTRGIHDSIVNYGGNKQPKLILCCHEGIAVAMASGYFRSTGRPMVVLLHDIVGLLHATKAIFDAWIDRDAVILIGGNGPANAEDRRPWIDWIHNALIPNTVIRDYVKWDDQPADIVSALEDLVRARNIALSEPAGPVYISIDAGLQEDYIKSRVVPPSPDIYHPPVIDEGSSQAMKDIAASLFDASKPAIVVDKYGRSDEDVAKLIELSEEAGIPVLDNGMLFNFPSNHPMNLSGLEQEILAESDLVLALGARDLYFHLAKREKGGFFSRKSSLVVSTECKIIRVDLEGVSINSWVSEYGRLTPTSLYVSAKPSSAVASILHFFRKDLGARPEARKHITERSQNIQQRSKELRRKWLETAEAESKKRGQISYPGLALVTREITKDEDWVLAFPGYSSRGINAWLRRTWDITKHYQYPGRGEGTGTGTGQALGVALANSTDKKRLCIDFQPDGDLLYSASSLWTAANSKIPILIIVMNNRSYYNDEEHNRFIANERRRSDASTKIGIRLEDPEVDFAHLARSYGINSTGPIKDYENLREALKQGVATVAEESKPYLIDILVSPSL